MLSWSNAKLALSADASAAMAEHQAISRTLNTAEEDGREEREGEEGREGERRLTYALPPLLGALTASLSLLRRARWVDKKEEEEEDDNGGIGESRPCVRRTPNGVDQGSLSNTHASLPPPLLSSLPSLSSLTSLLRPLSPLPP